MLTRQLSALVFAGIIASELAAAGGTTPVASDMALVPAGIFRSFMPERLAPGADPVFSEIQVGSFALDRVPVTNGEFLEFVAANPRWQRGRVSRLFADAGYLAHWGGDLELFDAAPRGSPVVATSWFAAKAFCAWRGKRLPTTVEWEYAASPAQYLGTLTGDPQQVILEWYGRPNPAVHPPVGSTFANRFGVYDLHGLVWEWTHDFNSAMSGSDGRKGSASETGLFCGAGALGALDPSAYANFMRIAFRSSIKGGFTLGNLGFRCAK